MVKLHNFNWMQETVGSREGADRNFASINLLAVADSGLAWAIVVGLFSPFLLFTYSTAWKNWSFCSKQRGSSTHSWDSLVCPFIREERFLFWLFSMRDFLIGMSYQCLRKTVTIFARDIILVHARYDICWVRSPKGFVGWENSCQPVNLKLGTPEIV